jgi:hypothetical protein
MDRSELELFQKCTGDHHHHPTVNEVSYQVPLAGCERGMALILARTKIAKVVSVYGGILRAILRRDGGVGSERSSYDGIIISVKTSDIGAGRWSVTADEVAFWGKPRRQPG